MTSHRLAVIFDMFGPYHMARLNALGAVAPTLGIEISARSKIYAWDPTQSETSFTRQTLFSTSDSSEVPGRELRERIWKALDEWDPRVVFVPGWASRAAFASLGWALANGKPTVVMSESTLEDHVRSPIKELVKRAMVGCFNAGFVGGSRNVAYLRSLGMPAEAISRGYNAVDNAFFVDNADAARADPDLRAKLGLPERYLLASARFIAIKNLPGLLKAFHEFLQRRPHSDVHLVLLGDGEERAVIEAQRTKLKLEERVLLPGFRQYEELPSYYGLAEGFVHVSAVEPWGLVVNEAMASGLPVIVSRVCGCADDIVQDGKNGFAVDHDDIDQIASALCRLEDAGPEGRLAMGACSREIAKIVAPDRFAAGACAAAEIALGRRPSLPLLLQRPVSRMVGRHFCA